MTEQKEQEIVDRVEKRVLEKLEKSVCKEDTQKVLQEPRNKWFRDANGSGTDSLMANALGNSFIAWKCMGADSAINMCCLRKEICKAAYRRRSCRRGM